MATPPNLTQIAFTGGLDESQQPEILDPSKGFPLLQNVRQTFVGAVEKRLGYGPLALTRLGTSSRSAGNRLFCYRDTVGTIDGTFLDTYAETTGTSVISSRVPEAGMSTRTTTATGDTLHDIVECNGYIACATHRGTSVYVGVETTAGALVRTPEVVHAISFASSTAFLGTYSNYIILISTRNSSANVAAFYLDTTSASTLATGWVSIGNVATDRSKALSSQSLTDRIAFAYVNNAGGTSQLTVKTITIAGVSQTQTVNTSSITPDVVGVEGSSSDTLWVGWNESGVVKLRGLNPSTLSSTLATTATIFASGYLNATTAPPHIVSSSTAGAGRMAIVTADQLLVNTFTTGGGAVVPGTATGVYGVIMDARPFRIGTRYYGLFRRMDASGTPSVSGISTNGISVMGDWTDAATATTAFIRPVGYAFPNLTNTITNRALHPIVRSTSAAYATPVLRSAAGTSMELLTYDFASTARWKCVPHNRSLMLSGGVTSCFDGRRVAESSFLHAPIKPVATDSGAGVGVTGPVRYVTTFEEVDSDGNWTVSSVSVPSDALTITNHTATVVVFPLALSARLSATSDPRVRVCLWRTTSSGVAPYYYVTDIANDTSTYSTFSDSTTDTVLSTQRLLLGTGNLPGTNGSAQDRRAPPFAQDLTSYNGMLVVASGSDLWWSGQTVSGEGTWWNPIFAVPVEGGAGDIVALAVQDGTLYIFKRSSIFAVAGNAPSDNGASGGLGVPQRLATDTGCVQPNSVVVTSQGIFFQSERGIDLLGRGGSVSWIGWPVQIELATYPVVTSAVLDDRNNLVRFSLATAVSGGRVSGVGRDIVYDLTLNQWQSVDDKTGTSAHEASQDASMVYVANGWRYAWLGADGTVRYERDTTDASAYLDGSTWITMAGETGSFKQAGIQGTQQLNSVLVLARKTTDCDLSVSLAYNYESSFRTARTWLRTDISTLLSAGWPITQLKHEAHDDAVCQGIRVRLADATPTGGTVGNGKGTTWIALTLDITPKPGIFDVPEGAT